MAAADPWVQDVITCDVCNKPTQQFCNSCQVSLCNPCSKNHIDQLKFLMHDIVPFLDRKIQLVCPECQHHPGQRCEANCLQCSEPVCLKCIISGPHKEHEVEELTKAYENKKQRIAEDTEEIKTALIPKCQRKTDDIENRMSMTKTQFDDIKKESKKLRQLWHQEVDSIFDKIESMNQSHREENLNALQAYHIKIKNLISKMIETVEQNEKLLKTNKISDVKKYKSKLELYRNFPEKVDLKVPSLCSSIYQGKELSIEIGDFRAILKQSKKQSLSADVTIRKGGLMDNVRIIITIPTKYTSLYDVACVGKAEAWILGDNNTITRIDIHGTVKDTVTTNGRNTPNRISVTIEKELIYSDFDNKTVNIARHGKSETLIIPPKGWVPMGICCTRSGDILIHIYLRGKNKIISCKVNNIKQEIYNNEQGEPIFKNGIGKLYMSENNNGDICVSDTNANTVVGVDNTGRVRFQYDGTPARRWNLFAPRGIVTDALSQIIVADYNNNCLHILDQNGRFLRCVDKCGLEKPHGLSVDSEGRLWVGCESGKVKVIEHLKND